MTIYKIILDNYRGENNVELYHNKENARKRFEELREEGMSEECEEFEGDEFEISFFDANYNDHYTFINFEECELDSLFYD